jgi:hypothetical protein
MVWRTRRSTHHPRIGSTAAKLKSRSVNIGKARPGSNRQMLPGAANALARSEHLAAK